jgi:hypothetical protein
VDFARAVGDLVIGLYVGGSLASGDYRPGISDIDAVALVPRSPTPRTRAFLAERHGELLAAQGGVSLHCVYVPADAAAEVTRKHWTWAFEEFFRRPLSGIARAELLADPIVLIGPRPATWLPALGPHGVGDAARAELSGYWTRALRQRAIWLEDVYVDIGLTVWARAEAAIETGALITKTEAITRMSGRLPAHIVEGIARRRNGDHVELTAEQRLDRASFARRFLTDEIARLLETAD